jgi:hypothetical protein
LSDLETSLHMQSWADYIIGTHESSFWKRQRSGKADFHRVL